ncbi:MAG: hypothetical protein LBH07_05780, partial [Treponema sp.]|nr:hypothetical protein [Treponema sp.]
MIISKSFVLFFVLSVLIMFVPVLEAQTPGETIMQSYERIFIRSGLNTKVNVLSDAAKDDAAPEFYGRLCDLALRFVIENSALFREDPDMLSLTIIAVKGLGEYAYSPGAETLWQAFLRFPDNVIRYAILMSLSSMNIPSNVVGRINEYLTEQNRRYNSGYFADHDLLSALFTLLGKAGDDSSYPVLYASSFIYPTDLKTEAIRALLEINGDFSAFCMKIIINNPPVERLEIFKMALAQENLSQEEKSALAEIALEAALAVPTDRRNETRELIELSVNCIKENRWVRALPLMLNYYNQNLTAFRTDPARKTPLINAISCLGFLRSAEAARALALQLGIYNSRSNTLGTEELEVVLAMVNALGELGYRVS